MPEVENKPKNWVKNRSPQGHFEGQDSLPLSIDCNLNLSLTLLNIVYLRYERDQEEVHSAIY